MAPIKIKYDAFNGSNQYNNWVQTQREQRMGNSEGAITCWQNNRKIFKLLEHHKHNNFKQPIYFSEIAQWQIVEEKPLSSDNQRNANK